MTCGVKMHHFSQSWFRIRPAKHNFEINTNYCKQKSHTISIFWEKIGYLSYFQKSFYSPAQQVLSFPTAGHNR